MLARTAFACAHFPIRVQGIMIVSRREEEGKEIKMKATKRDSIENIEHAAQLVMHTHMHSSH